MKIVVLDGYALNPGDLSWDGVKPLAEDIQVYDRTKTEDIVERAREADLILTNKTPLAAETLKQLPKLRYIGVLATGYNIVDVEAAAAQDIIVTNIPSYSTQAVAQLVFALILEFCHNVKLHSDAVKGGEWASSADFSFTKAPLVELSGKTMGIIGYGSIGKAAAQLAEAFGMNVIAAGSGRPNPSADRPLVSKEEVFKQADFISLHCPLTESTKGMISKETIRLMKPNAILINTARGGLIVDQDLADALNEGIIAGAGLDVLTMEPPEPDNPLLKAPNCLITPHIAWATKEARARLMKLAAENIAAYQKGRPIHVVNKSFLAKRV